MAPRSLYANIAERRARRAAERAEAVSVDEVVEGQDEDLSVVQNDEVADSREFDSSDLVVMVLNYHTSAETFDPLFAKMSDDEAQKALISIRENRDRFPSPPDDLTNLLAVVAELLRHDPRYQQVVEGNLSEDQASYLETVSLQEAARSFLESGSFKSLTYPIEPEPAVAEDAVLDVPEDDEVPVESEMPHALLGLLSGQDKLNVAVTKKVVEAHTRLDGVEDAVAQLAAPVPIVTREDIDAHSSDDVDPVDEQPEVYDHASDPEFDAVPTDVGDIDVLVIVQEPHGGNPDVPSVPAPTAQEVFDVPLEFANAYIDSVDDCLAALNSVNPDS